MPSSRVTAGRYRARPARCARCRVSDRIRRRRFARLRSTSTTRRSIPTSGASFTASTLESSTPRKRHREKLSARARALVPAGKAHDWNSSLMDLGATICTARAPQCPKRPLRRSCAAAPIDVAALERRRRSALPATRKPAVAFEKTARYARGRIVDRLRELPPGERISLLDLHRALSASLPAAAPPTCARSSRNLERDGLISGDDDRIALYRE